jgi:hypothetical protein
MRILSNFRAVVVYTRTANGCTTDSTQSVHGSSNIRVGPYKQNSPSHTRNHAFLRIHAREHLAHCGYDSHKRSS